MSIFTQLNHPNWRYKMMWLGASAAIWLLATTGSETGSENQVLVFSFLSMVLAGSVIFWYAVLAVAGMLANAYVTGRGSALTLVGDVIVVWLVTGATTGVALWMTGFNLHDPSFEGLRSMSGSLLIAFVAAMRTMDLKEDAEKTVGVSPRINAAENDTPTRIKPLGPTGDLVDGKVVMIDGVPTRTIV